MSELVAFASDSLKNTVNIPFMDKLMKKTSQTGIAITMIGSALVAPLAHINSNLDTTKQVSYFLSSGVSSKGTTKNDENEENLNQFSFQGFNSTDDEYVKSNTVTQVILNGSLLEAKVEMVNRPENHDNDFEFAIASMNFDDVAFIPTKDKRTIIMSSIKRANGKMIEPDEEDFDFLTEIDTL